MYRSVCPFPSSTFPHVISYLSAASSGAFSPSSSRFASLDSPLTFLTARRNTSFPVLLSHSHLPLHTSLSLSFSPPPSLIPLLLVLCPSICAAQSCYRNQSIWNRRGWKLFLAGSCSSPISLHSRPPGLIFCSIYTVTLLTLFICATRCWSYCCHDYCGNIDIILHTVTMATSRVISRVLC